MPDIQKKKSGMMHNISLYEHKVVIVPQTNYNVEKPTSESICLLPVR